MAPKVEAAAVPKTKSTLLTLTIERSRAFCRLFANGKEYASVYDPTVRNYHGNVVIHNPQPIGCVGNVADTAVTPEIIVKQGGQHCAAFYLNGHPLLSFEASGEVVLYRNALNTNTPHAQPVWRGLTTYTVLGRWK